MPTSLKNYTQQLQCKPYWCWAAMGVSLVRHKGGGGANLTQCGLARDVLGSDNCCASGCTDCGKYVNCSAKDMPKDWCPGPSACDTHPDVAKFLDVLWKKYGIRYKRVFTSIPLSQIEKHLKAGWPVFIVRRDAGRSKHVLAITGVDGNWFDILDSEGDCKDGSFGTMLLLKKPGVNGGNIYAWSETFHPQ